MCGFTGFIGQLENKAEVLEKMMNTIIHRGPDSSGSYLDDEMALGFRRLSIIDIANTGDQPMFNEDKSKVLVFNGEIYNYQEIRKELVVKGHIFTTKSDSEVLLHGYEQWGDNLVNHLRGMYAFVIWDVNTKKMFGARDIFGIKPFYYAQMNNTFMFASEIKAFMEHPDFSKEFNQASLKKYLSFQFIPTNETFFKGVFCLQPGHCFTYENGVMLIKRYFKPDFKQNSDKSFEEVVDEVTKTMEESVAMHKVSDVKVASYLSSGIDSSYITYLGQVDCSFSVGFDNNQYSEIEEAKAFAKSINITNISKVIKPDEYWDSLSDIQYYMDEPIADPAAIALYFLSKEASKKVKVVLSGEGADELFGGYNIYCEPLSYPKYDKIPLWIRRFFGFVAEHCLPKKMKGRAFLMRRSKSLEQRYIGNAKIFSEKEVDKLIKDKNQKGCNEVTKPLYQQVSDKDVVTKMQYIDLHLWLVHDILMKADKMGMANSIETRVPYLDIEVMKLAQVLPLEYKIKSPTTKRALRAAANKVIPNKVADKKKLGFPIPIREWLKEDKYYEKVKELFNSNVANEYFENKYLMRLLEEHKHNKFDNSRKIWTVYIFLLWYERFFKDSMVLKA